MWSLLPLSINFLELWEALASVLLRGALAADANLPEKLISSGYESDRSPGSDNFYLGHC